MKKYSSLTVGAGMAIGLMGFSAMAISATPFQADKMPTGYNIKAPATALTKTAHGQCGAGRCGATSTKIENHTSEKLCQKCLQSGQKDDCPTKKALEHASQGPTATAKKLSKSPAHVSGETPEGSSVPEMKADGDQSIPDSAATSAH